MSKELKLRLLQISSLVEQVASVYSSNLEDLEAEEVEALNGAQILVKEADSMNCPANTRGLWEKQNKAKANLDSAISYKEGLDTDLRLLRAELRNKEVELEEIYANVAILKDILHTATFACTEANTPYLTARKAADSALVLAAITGSVTDSVRASRLLKEKS